MNKLDNLKDSWRNNTEQAIEKINQYLNANNDYEQEFKKLANWLVNTPLNHYGFMTHDDAYAIDNAVNFASLLGRIHHAMVDDGDICFVTVEDRKALMLFAYAHDEDYLPDLLANSLKDLNQSLQTTYNLSKTIADNLPVSEKKDKYLQALQVKPQSLKDLTITTHTSVDRFINEVEELERNRLERITKFEELRKNSNKPKMK